MALDRDAGMLAALGSLIDGAHLAVPDELPTVFRESFRKIGWRVTVYLADFHQRALRPLADERPAESIDGSLAGRCFRHSSPTQARRPQAHWWVPLIDGVDRLGVVRLELPPGLSLEDSDVAAHVRWAVYVMGHLIATKSPYCDYFHVARLDRERTISSELVWSMLPPLTVAAEGIAIAGSLEPNHSLGGDIFDYAIDDHVAHLAIADATGHDLNAALIGAVVLAGYRAGRRQQQSLRTTVAAIDEALVAIAPDTYASAVFGELDMRAGVLRYTVAGHPAPLLMRDGKIVKSLDGGRRILLGFPGHDVPLASEVLEPGDWIVLYTDGVIEARDARGRMFGLDRLIGLLQRCAADRQNASESLRRIVHQVIEHQQGALQDDCTIVLTQWMSTLEHQLAST